MNPFYSTPQLQWTFGISQYNPLSSQKMVVYAQPSYYYQNQTRYDQPLYQVNQQLSSSDTLAQTNLPSTPTEKIFFNDDYQKQRLQIDSTDHLPLSTSSESCPVLKSNQSNEESEKTKKIETIQSQNISQGEKSQFQNFSLHEVEKKFANYRELKKIEKNSLKIISTLGNLDKKLTSKVLKTPFVFRQQLINKRPIMKQKIKLNSQLLTKKNKQSSLPMEQLQQKTFLPTGKKFKQQHNGRNYQLDKKSSISQSMIFISQQKEIPHKEKADLVNYQPINKQKEVTSDEYLSFKKENSSNNNSISEELRQNINKIDSIQSAIEDLQDQKPKKNILDTLSKCIFVTQSSQIKKVVDKIIDSPYFVMSQKLKDQSSNNLELKNNQSIEIKQSSLNNQSNLKRLHDSKKVNTNQRIDDNLRQFVLNQISFFPENMKQLSLYDFRVMRDFNANKLNPHPEENCSTSIITSPTSQSLQLKFSQEEETRKKKSIKSLKSQKQFISRFHNLNKLFICNIMQMFQQENLENFKIPQPFKTEILNFLHLFKQSGKLRLNIDEGDNDVATELKKNVSSFSHVHYNTLFLKINDSNIKVLQKNARDIQMHNFCYKLDLFNCLEIEICRVNLLKKIMFQIFMLSINEQNYKIDLFSNSKLKNRVLYAQKAIQGIKKLSFGIYFNRF